MAQPPLAWEGFNWLQSTAGAGKTKQHSEQVLSRILKFLKAVNKDAESEEINGMAVQSVSWILAEFYFNRGLQRLYTGTCIILQKKLTGFFVCLLFFLKVKHIS